MAELSWWSRHFGGQKARDAIVIALLHTDRELSTVDLYRKTGIGLVPLYVCLNELYAAGVVTFRQAMGGPGRGWRRKRFYWLCTRPI